MCQFVPQTDTNSPLVFAAACHGESLNFDLINVIINANKDVITVSRLLLYLLYNCFCNYKRII